MATRKDERDESSTLIGVDDGSFHDQEIKWQRVGRIGLAAFVIAGLLGTFGSGPLSNAAAVSSDGRARVDYERWIRANAPTSVRLRTSAAERNAIRLSLDENFVESIQLLEIRPTPARTSAESGKLELEIVVANDDSAEVVIRYQRSKVGMASAEIGIGGTSVRFSQFVFP